MYILEMLAIVLCSVPEVLKMQKKHCSLCPSFFLELRNSLCCQWQVFFCLCVCVYESMVASLQSDVKLNGYCSFLSTTEKLMEIWTCRGLLKNLRSCLSVFFCPFFFSVPRPGASWDWATFVARRRAHWTSTSMGWWDLSIEETWASI